MKLNVYKLQLVFVVVWLVFVVMYLAKKEDHNSYKAKVNDYEYYIEWRNTIFQLIVAVAVLHYLKK